MSRGTWVKVRKKISKYPETEQQKKIRVAGKLIRAACKGLKEREFFDCRSMALQCALNDKCSIEHHELKKKLKEQDEH